MSDQKKQHKSTAPPKSDAKNTSNSKTLPRSALETFDISFPKDPHFITSNANKRNKAATADDEWRQEGWYFVPPKSDGTGKPVYGEFGEPGESGGKDGSKEWGGNVSEGLWGDDHKERKA